MAVLHLLSSAQVRRSGHVDDLLLTARCLLVIIREISFECCCDDVVDKLGFLGLSVMNKCSWGKTKCTLGLWKMTAMDWNCDAHKVDGADKKSLSLLAVCDQLLLLTNQRHSGRKSCRRKVILLPSHFLRSSGRRRWHYEMCGDEHGRVLCWGRCTPI